MVATNKERGDVCVCLTRIIPTNREIRCERCISISIRVQVHRTGRTMPYSDTYNPGTKNLEVLLIRRLIHRSYDALWRHGKSFVIILVAQRLEIAAADEKVNPHATPPLDLADRCIDFVESAVAATLDFRASGCVEFIITTPRHTRMRHTRLDARGRTSTMMCR